MDIFISQKYNKNCAIVGKYIARRRNILSDLNIKKIIVQVEFLKKTKANP